MTLKPGTKVLVQYEATVAQSDHARYPGQTHVRTDDSHWDTFTRGDIARGMLTVLSEPEPEPTTVEVIDGLKPLQRIVVKTSGGTDLFRAPVTFLEVVTGVQSIIFPDNARRIRYVKDGTSHIGETWVYGTDTITLVD